VHLRAPAFSLSIRHPPFSFSEERQEVNQGISGLLVVADEWKILSAGRRQRRSRRPRSRRSRPLMAFPFHPLNLTTKPAMIGNRGQMEKDDRTLNRRNTEGTERKTQFPPSASICVYLRAPAFSLSILHSCFQDCGCQLRCLRFQ
jgi:hypothetical protein